MATIHRLRKADARSGSGGYSERVLRRAFKQAMHIKKPRMCRGCSRLKTECTCPKSCLEASRRFNLIIEKIRAEGRQRERERRVERRRAKIKLIGE